MSQAKKPAAGHGPKGKVGFLDNTLYLALSQGVLNFQGYVVATEYILNDNMSVEDAIHKALADGAITDGAHGTAAECAEIAIFMINRGGKCLTTEDARAIAKEHMDAAGYHAEVGGYYINHPDISVYGTVENTVTTDRSKAAGDPAFHHDADDYVEYASGTGINWTLKGTVGEGEWTLVDNLTGLEWQGDPGRKYTWKEGMEGLEAFNEAGYSGHNDWRVPTLKEVYSLAMLSGIMDRNIEDTKIFIPGDFEIGLDEHQTRGDRWMDRQIMTSTIYSGHTVGTVSTVFGWNGSDGRVKGYPTNKTFYLYHVRNTDGSAPTYGKNVFEAKAGETESDATVQDLATNRQWTKYDSVWYYQNDAKAKAWMDENSARKDGSLCWLEGMAFAHWAATNKLAGHDDWVLPTSKELHSILDYDQSIEATNYAAINPDFFHASKIDTFGVENYGYYVSSTLFLEPKGGYDSVYVGFGMTLGSFDGIVLDVHGQGAQRDDPEMLPADHKAEDYPLIGYGPQGDDVRLYNVVRLVRKLG